jgi:alkylation response protein AidB-like acyl-CoA dehydrogenase
MTVDLELSDDQAATRDLFTAFFAREAPTSVARASEPLGFDPALWERIREIGAPGMGAPTAFGGGGATLGDLVVVAEELGRSIAPVPLVEHLVAARLLLSPDVLDGTSIACLAFRPATDDGTWRLVPAGAVADVVVGLDGEQLVAVRAAPPGSGPRNHASAPLADRSARVGDREVIGTRAEFERARDEWKVLLAAALAGIADAALDLGVEYAKARQQFGVPIGSFQAVQHGLADLPALVDGARLLAHKAAWAGERTEPGRCDVDDNDVTDFSVLASMAFLFSTDAAARATDRSLHFHGGYGFSTEYDIQLYYRRARGWPLVFDDPGRECLRLADRLWGPSVRAAEVHAPGES